MNKTPTLTTQTTYQPSDNIFWMMMWGWGSISRNGFLGLALADNEIEPDRMSDQISLFIESTVE